MSLADLKRIRAHVGQGGTAASVVAEVLCDSCREGVRQGELVLALRGGGRKVTIVRAELASLQPCSECRRSP